MVRVERANREASVIQIATFYNHGKQKRMSKDTVHQSLGCTALTPGKKLQGTMGTG